MTQNESSPSTLSLFTTILNKAEADFIAAGAGAAATANDNNASSTTSVTARAKLFHIATQLVRLNLSHDDTHHSSNGSVKLWCIILRFMSKYPDYALYRIIASSSKKETKTRQNGYQDERNDDEEGQDDEEMVYWLMPRLLRCMILHQSTRSPLKIPADGEGVQAGKADGDASADDVVKQGEKWICYTLTNCSRSWYRREEGGLRRRRELVKALLKVAQGERVSSDSGSGAA